MTTALRALERTTPKRIQRKRTKGWRMPEGTVYVGRPTVFGNPFPVDVYGRADAVDLFRRWLTGQISPLELSQCSRCDRWSGGQDETVTLGIVRGWIMYEIPRLRGRDLVCWCPLDAPCHADVLLELANR